MEVIFISGLFLHTSQVAESSVEELKNSLVGLNKEVSMELESKHMDCKEEKSFRVELAEGAFFP